MCGEICMVAYISKECIHFLEKTEDSQLFGTSFVQKNSSKNKFLSANFDTGTYQPLSKDSDQKNTSRYANSIQADMQTYTERQTFS